MLTELQQLPLSDLLGFTVLAALVTTTGSLIALWLKEFVFARSFEAWKTKQVLEQVYQKYRKPILLAAEELVRRLEQINESYPPTYLQSQLLCEHSHHMEGLYNDDPYYQVYKQKSTIYRLCALLGWRELYRRDVVLLGSKKKLVNQKLESCLEAIDDDLSNGWLNEAPNQFTTDRLVFHDEQRAIGECMIVELAGKSLVMDYGHFCELLNQEDDERSTRWLQQATYFLTELQPAGKDFRQMRFRLLAIHLYDLVEALKPTPLSDQQQSNRIEDTKLLFRDAPKTARDLADDHRLNPQYA